MSMFCVIEGIDGSGKSHLARDLADSPELTVARKDDLPTRTSWADERLAAMHALTWNYNPEEPVWEYPRRYWLFTQLAWYSLFYEHRIAEPLSKPGSVVVTDGWYFKHQARFRLSNDAAFSALADDMFAELPQPDLIVLVDTPVTEARRRKEPSTRPTEAGAFDSPAAATRGEGFETFQQRTRDVLVQLLDDHPADVWTVQPPIDNASLTARISSFENSR